MADSWDDVFLWAARTPVPGSVQTVPRAELFAVLVIVTNVGGGATTVFTDSQTNANLFARGRQSCSSSENADLWLAIFQLVDSKGIQLDLVWIKGHADQIEVFLRYQVSPKHLLGNLIADTFANMAADECQVLYEDSIAVQWHFALVRKIQLRAVRILSTVLEARLPFTSEQPKLSTPRALSLDARVIQSQHSFAKYGRTLQCIKCLQFSPLNACAKARWLASACVPDMQVLNTLCIGAIKPSNIPSGKRVSVGRSVLHPSHKLAVFRGLFFCADCGYVASAKAQKLVGECTDRGPAAVRRVIRIRQGLLPSGMTQWPNEAPLQARTLQLA